MKDRCFRLTNEYVTTYGTIFIHMYVRTFTELLLLSFFSSNLPSPSSSSIRIALSAPSLFPLCLNFFSFKSTDKSSCFPGRVRQKPSTVDFPTTGTTPFGSEFDPIVNEYHNRANYMKFFSPTKK